MSGYLPQPIRSVNSLSPVCHHARMVSSQSSSYYTVCLPSFQEANHISPQPSTFICQQLGHIHYGRSFRTILWHNLNQPCPRATWQEDNTCSRVCFSRDSEHKTSNLPHLTRFTADRYYKYYFVCFFSLTSHLFIQPKVQSHRGWLTESLLYLKI